MIKSYKNKANFAIGFGLLLSLGARIAIAQLAWRVGAGQVRPSPVLGLSLLAGFFGGYVMFVRGCVMYAWAKGRSGWWGAFGLLSLFGLIFLVFLKDFARDGSAQESRGFDPIIRR